MAFKLLVILEALVNVVSGDKILHATIHCSLKGWTSHHLGTPTILKHLVNLFKPKRNEICIFVTNGPEVATNLAHVVSTKKGIFVRKAKLQIISNLVHSPRLVHLRDGVVGIDPRVVAARLDNLL
jgi:hypothetical protein